jgi:spermidine/putrescine transport system substrate-binding protein
MRSSLFLVALLFSQLAIAQPRELVFLTWSDYVDPALLSAFESRCGCVVRQVFFETDDFRDELMLESEGAGFDVVIVNGLMLDRYRRRGWLEPVLQEGLANLSHVNPRWVEAFEAAAGHAVPYFWGTMGIAYRKDLVQEPITSWRQFFEPPETLRGKLALIRSARDMLTGPLKALGYSLNATDPAQLAEAEHLLAAQKPYVFSYSYVSLSEQSTLVTGEVVAAVTFNGDALVLQQHEPNIVYVLPEEGSEIWVDYLTVSARSTNKALAWRFIDFLNQPDNAARNARFVHYASPNLAAERLLPAEFLADPVIYPGAESLKNSEFYRSLPPRVERKYSEIYNRMVE